ncbi:MAG: hypothetical protein PHD37_10960 [Gallionellaceae bacterium]|nr:hypothetical protein [Gallionellaceae bacterium]
MSIFNDTIHDARRPLAGGWVRRSLDESEAGAPEESIAQDSMPSGMQTVFRFQKAGQVMPREASIQPGAGLSRSPTGDPLSAAAEGESPRPSATNDGETLISVLGDSRVSELATGQVIHGSPGKVAAANVVSESKTHQSVVLPGPIETELNRETHRSEIPEGGERLVSRQSETFQSRPTGRGAPSESSLTTATARLGAAARGTRGAAFAADFEPAPWTAERDGGMADSDFEATPAREFPPETRASVAATATRPGRAAHAASPGSDRGDSDRSREANPPGLIIGRIDVVVVADAAPVQPQPTARADRGFLSRNYLKRL